MATQKEESFTWYMQNIKGVHRKFYNIIVKKTTSGWSLSSHWGRIGNTGRERIISNYSSYSAVKRAAESLKLEKEGRGYEDNTTNHVELQVQNAENTTEAVKKRALNRFVDLLE